MLQKNTLENYANKWFAFLGIALLSFGAYLDYTVVNIALPTIQQELHANLISLQWVMNIYFLTLCTLATIIGRLGDLYGRRLCFYLGAGIFVIASVVAGLSSTIHWLIFGRFLQGLGAAAIFPLGPSLLPQSFPEQQRSRAIAWLGSLGGIALALGPVLGGLIVTHWGWRWIFFINIPIVLLGYAFSFKSVHESPRESRHASVDFKGMLLLAVTLSALVLGLISSQNPEAIFKTFLNLGIAVFAAVLLVIVERKQENPLIDFKDFARLLFFSGAILCFLAGVLSAVTLFFDPLYLQIIKNQSPQLAGLILFAIPIAVFLVAFLVGGLIERLGIINTILLGLILACLSAALQIFFRIDTPIFYIIIAFICLGSVWAMGNTVSIIAAQNGVSPERRSVATGTVVTMFNIGGSIGLAMAVVIYHSVGFHVLMKKELKDAAQLTILKEFIANPASSLQAGINATTHYLFKITFIQGFAGVMWFLFILSFVILLLVATWKFVKKERE